MSQKLKSTLPPPIMPALKLVDTGEIVAGEDGKKYRALKLVREARSDVNYTVKRPNAT